jgi:hypothetical protein
MIHTETTPQHARGKLISYMWQSFRVGPFSAAAPHQTWDMDMYVLRFAYFGIHVIQYHKRGKLIADGLIRVPLLQHAATAGALISLQK